MVIGRGQGLLEELTVHVSSPAARTERACTSRPTLVRSVNIGASHTCG
jgi:hypothetical protein